MQIFMSLMNYTYLGGLSWLEDVYNVLPPILYTILAVVGGAGTLQKATAMTSERLPQRELKIQLLAWWFCLFWYFSSISYCLKFCMRHIQTWLCSKKSKQI